MGICTPIDEARKLNRASDELTAAETEFDAALAVLVSQYPNMQAVGWVLPGGAVGAVTTVLMEGKNILYSRSTEARLRALATILAHFPEPLVGAFEEEFRATRERLKKEGSQSAQDAPEGQR